MTASDARIVLDGSELTAPPDAQPTGPLDPDERIEVSVMIRPRHSLVELEAQLNQPPTVALSRAAFAACFGADPSDVAKVKAFARQQGLDVVEASLARRTVRLAGRAGVIRAAFGIQLVHYRRAADACTFRGYTGAIQLPADLAGIVQAVFGLDTRPVARRLHSEQSS